MNTQAQPVADNTSPFHPGERNIQLQAGVRAEAEQRGQIMLNDQLSPLQRQFFQQRPFVVTAHSDSRGQPWAGLVVGTPGFLQPEEDSNRVFLHWHKANNLTGVEAPVGHSIGMLGIDFASQRRNRLNATVFSSREDEWRMIIDQGYGNCPKYIQPRPWQPTLFAAPYRQYHLEPNDLHIAAMVESADTFFIASSSGPAFDSDITRPSAWGADISHRGGKPGFIRMDNRQLKLEDYPGNKLFNTLGNLQQYPYCGLLFIDFERGHLLQLAGQAAITISGDQRYITITLSEARYWQPTTGTTP